MAIHKAAKKLKYLMGFMLLLGLLTSLITPGSSAARRATYKFSITSNKKIIRLGKALFVKGRLVSRSGRPLKGRLVALEKKSAKHVIKRIRGKKRKVKKYYWRRLGRKRTNTRGYYAFGLRPKKSATYRARVARTVSRQIRVKVIAIYSMRNRLGFAVGNHLVSKSDAELASQLDGMAAIGVRWIRHDMQWNVIQPNNSTSYNWRPYDRLVSAAAKKNIKVLAILTYTPRWARTPSAANSMFAAPANNAQFARFAATTVKHYAPMGIHAYEIWNEPNLPGFWQPAPNVAAYSDLLKKSYVSIKQANPSAIIVSGGLAPAVTSNGRISPRDFVSGMYKRGVKGHFNALGHHPYTFPALPSNYYEWSAWSQMSDTKPSLRSIMARYGDRKPIWGTEFGMPTNAAGGVSKSLQAKSIKTAAALMKGRPWLGKLFIYSYKDIGNSTSTAENFFGVVGYDGGRKPGYYSVRNALAN